jgi:hypothetical protein
MAVLFSSLLSNTIFSISLSVLTAVSTLFSVGFLELICSELNPVVLIVQLYIHQLFHVLYSSV